MTVSILSAAQASLATALLCEAFAEYPVMRYVLGSAADYPKRLHTLINFFVTARVLREDLILGTFDSSRRLAGVSLVTLPGDREAPEALALRREATWRELGSAERGRYEAFGAASSQFAISVPHHHLNMIGISPSQVGSGHARTLLDYLHRLAAEHPHSEGVSLSTETRGNLSLYEHFGYRQLGSAKVGAELETWAFYRPKLGRIMVDAWNDGAKYEPYIGRWSRGIAREFLSWLAFPAEGVWLDVGCGTGALSASILANAVPRAWAARGVVA